MLVRLVLGTLHKYASRNRDPGLKTVQNALKWPFQFANFQNISAEHARRPSGAFLFLNLLQSDSAGKITLEKMSKFGALSSKELLIRPTPQA